MRITFESDDGYGTSIIHVVEPKRVKDGFLHASWHASDRLFAIEQMKDVFCAETAVEIFSTGEILVCQGCELKCDWLIRVNASSEF